MRAFNNPDSSAHGATPSFRRQLLREQSAEELVDVEGLCNKVATLVERLAKLNWFPYSSLGVRPWSFLGYVDHTKSFTFRRAHTFGVLIFWYLSAGAGLG